MLIAIVLAIITFERVIIQTMLDYHFRGNIFQKSLQYAISFLDPEASHHLLSDSCSVQLENSLCLQLQNATGHSVMFKKEPKSPACSSYHSLPNDQRIVATIFSVPFLINMQKKFGHEPLQNRLFVLFSFP